MRFVSTCLNNKLPKTIYWDITIRKLLMKIFCSCTEVYITLWTSEELDGYAVSALRRAIAEVKQRWSVIGWVTKNVLSRAPQCFGRHAKPLVPAAFAVVSTHQSKLGPRGRLWPVFLMCNPYLFSLYVPFSLCVIHKEGLCPSSGGINELMMMKEYL
jgi:hypothetical protein